MKNPNTIWCQIEEIDAKALKNDPRYPDYGITVNIYELIDYDPRFFNNIQFDISNYWLVSELMYEYGFAIGSLESIDADRHATFRFGICVLGIDDNRIERLHHNRFLKQHECLLFPNHVKDDDPIGYIEIPKQYGSEVIQYLSENTFECRPYKEFETSSIYGLWQQPANYAYQADETGTMKIMKLWFQ